MRTKPEGWNIIVAGFWNRLIFTPEWVREQVFGRDCETYVALLPVLPIIFKDESVHMEVSLARLLFRPLKLADDGVLTRAEKMARDVLTKLSETPVQAVGVNFAYVEDFPPDHLVAVFNDHDPRDLETMGWAIDDRKLTRRLKKDGETLNLTMAFDGKSVTFDLNFHTEATANNQACQAVEQGRAVALRQQGLELIQDVYQLELEEDGDGDND